MSLFEVISQQNAVSTNRVIDYFLNEDEDNNKVLFVKVAAIETDSILKRDDEDAEKLSKGIQIAIDKGVLDANIDVEPTIEVDVLGKSSDEVADAILSQVPSGENGIVIVLQGLSGTGKGTTVAKLQQKLSNAVTWSNGNLFRSFSLLATAYCKQHEIELTESVLTGELLHELEGMLQFGKFNGIYDIKITGLGFDTYVSEIELTELKSAVVSTTIPTVAKFTQGEVVKFASSAISLMRQDGVNVLVEGRAETLKYVRSPYRFQLTLSDKQLIGQRRLAQKVMAKVIEGVKKGGRGDGDDEVRTLLGEALLAIAGTWGLGK